MRSNIHTIKHNHFLITFCFIFIPLIRPNSAKPRQEMAQKAEMIPLLSAPVYSSQQHDLPYSENADVALCPRLIQRHSIENTIILLRSFQMGTHASLLLHICSSCTQRDFGTDTFYSGGWLEGAACSSRRRCRLIISLCVSVEQRLCQADTHVTWLPFKKKKKKWRNKCFLYRSRSQWSSIDAFRVLWEVFVFGEPYTKPTVFQPQQLFIVCNKTLHRGYVESGMHLGAKLWAVLQVSSHF